MTHTMTHEDTMATRFAQAKAGDRTAFDALVQETRDLLRSTIERRVGPLLRQRLNPEDVLQETYLRAFQSIERIEWRGHAAFARWLAAIAENLILDAARRRRHYPELALERDVPDSDTAPSAHLRRKERFDRLKDSLAGLSEDHRQVIVLARIEGLSTEEIAHRMNRSTSAVRNLLSRAMRQLRSSFGDTESFGLPDQALEDERQSRDS